MGSSNEILEDAAIPDKSSASCVCQGRWLGLSGAMLMMGCNGLAYTYAVYSEFAKETLHYTQEQTDDLGAAKDFGSLVGLISGLFYFFFPPWVSVCIGAVLHLFGYGMVLLTISGKISISFWLLCFYFAIGSGGDNWVDTACIMTSMQNFDEYKGTSVGILKSQLGLSAAIFVMVYEAFFDSNVSKFLFLITIAPTIVYLVAAFLIRPFPINEQDMEVADVTQRFQMACGSVVILGMFLMMSIILKDVLHLDGKVQVYIATAMLVMVAVTCIIPLLYRPWDLLQSALFLKRPHHHVLNSEVVSKRIELHNYYFEKNKLDPDGDEPEEGNLLESTQDSWKEGCRHTLEIGGPVGHCKVENPIDANLWESLSGLDFWLITFVVSSGAGAGLAIINNFAQIGKAVESDGVDKFVGIISIWSCYGRLAAGYGSDLVMSAGFPRPLCLLISQIAMCVCCLLLSTGCKFPQTETRKRIYLYER
eukprot:c5741_g1_i2 orf=285-1715(+)